MAAPTGPRRVALSATFFAALACVLPMCSHAQSGGAISGTVTGSDGHPLSGVAVAATDLGLSVSTNATGRYVLLSLPAGHHVLQFHRVGYASHEVTVDVSGDTSLTADVVLESEPIELGSVLVEGVSRAPDRMIDAPAAVEMVRPDASQPLTLTGQVPLALARVPGIDLSQENITDFDVNARGFNTQLNRKMLVLQDGRDLANGIVGSEIWGVLSQPFEDFARIEVIRGPGSALYGANAYNGVINIATAPARDVAGTKVTLGGGELGTVRADLRHAGVLLHDRLGYRVNVGYGQSGDWTRSRTAKNGSDWKEEYAPATSTPPPRSPLPDSLPLIGQTKDPVTGQALGTPDPVASIYGSARVDYYGANASLITFEGGTAQLDNSVFLGGNTRSQAPRIVRPWARLAWDAGGNGLSAWYSGVSSSFVGLARGTRSYLDENLFHLEGRASRRFHGDASRVVVGASVQDNSINSKGTVLAPAYDDRSDQYYGAFAQLEYGVGHIRAIAAVRWDDSDLFPAQLSPKGAVVWSPAAPHALHLSVERAFLTPILANFFFGGAPAGRGVQDLSAIEAALRTNPSLSAALAKVPLGKLFETSAAVPESAFGNTHLVPQTVTSYEIGYKGQFGPRVFITLDAYDAHIQNFLTALLPAGATRLNPAFGAWTAPLEVPAGSQAEVDSAVLSALLTVPLSPGGQPCGSLCAYGLTRLANNTSAVVLSYGNVGALEEWGLEVGTTVSLTRVLTVSTSYTWYNFAVRQNQVVGNVLAANTPRNKGTVALTYAGRQGIELGVDARIVSRYHWKTGVWDGDVPASQFVNLNAGYHLNPHLRVYGNASDVFDQQRFQIYGGAVIGRRVLVGATWMF